MANDTKKTEVYHPLLFFTFDTWYSNRNKVAYFWAVDLVTKEKGEWSLSFERAGYSSYIPKGWRQIDTYDLLRKTTYQIAYVNEKDTFYFIEDDKRRYVPDVYTTIIETHSIKRHPYESEEKEKERKWQYVSEHFLSKRFIPVTPFQYKTLKKFFSPPFNIEDMLATIDNLVKEGNISHLQNLALEVINAFSAENTNNTANNTILSEFISTLQTIVPPTFLATQLALETDREEISINNDNLLDIW